MNAPTPSPISRREFVGRAAAAGAGWLRLPSGLRAGRTAPSNKLNIALIGVLGRGRVFHAPLAEENVVALCDVNEAHLAQVKELFPRAKTHVDWRKCLEQKDVDAVVICTADHTHAFITNWALNRDLHVYCEKPLAITIEEVRLVRAKWLAKKGKLATQGGTEVRANHNRIRELIRDGAIGELSAAYAWGSRQIRRAGYWPAAGKPAPGFHYDLWLGPSPYHPYNPRYFMKGSVEGPGANAVCLAWNMFWDFGTGQVGDMGAHNMNLLWHAIDATLPTAVTAKGEPYNPDVTPVELECQFEHPANDWRGPITVHWSQGGIKPRSPKPYIDIARITDGVMFKGSKGHLVGNYRGQERAESHVSLVSFIRKHFAAVLARRAAASAARPQAPKPDVPDVRYGRTSGMYSICGWRNRPGRLRWCCSSMGVVSGWATRAASPRSRMAGCRRT